MADGTAGRVPPNDLDAEAVVLSAILLAPDAFDRVQAILQPPHFYADANRRIFEAVVELTSNGRPVDIVSVASFLRDKGRLQQVGGSPYLAQLSDATPSIGHVEEHARRVVEKALQRQLIAAASRVAAEGYGDVGDVAKWAQDAAQELADVAAEGDVGEPAQLLSEIMSGELQALAERARSGNGLIGVDTGLRELNGRTGGLMRGKVHTVGARPGMGKSTIMLQIARNVAAKGQGALVASLEMTKSELATKLLAAEARIDSMRLASGKVERSDWPVLTTASGRLAKLPLSLRYCPGATLSLLRSTVRQERNRLRARGVELVLVVVDYLQLMQGPRERGQTRAEFIGILMRGLLQVAAEFDVAVLVGSQLNRALENRSNKSKRPNLADLRESGDIEQDSYSVTLLYRADKYDTGTRHRGVLEADVAKIRGGAEGRALLRFTPEYSRIDDLAEGYEIPEDELDAFDR